MPISLFVTALMSILKLAQEGISSLWLKKLFLFVLLGLAVNFAVMAGQPKQFTVKDTVGNLHTLSQYKDKWVIVNYWATWCTPCLEEVPDLVALYDSWKDKNVMVIGVVFDYESTQAVANYVDDMLITYPIVYGDDAVIKQIGRADALPTSYIFNPQGELIKVRRGKVSRQYLESLMKLDSH